MTRTAAIGAVLLLAASCGGGETGGEGGPDAGLPIDVPPPKPLQPPKARTFPPLGEYPAPPARLPTVSITLAETELMRLEADPFTDVEAAAVVEWDGERAPAKVRFRGASTRDLPQHSWNVNLGAGYQLDGRDKFELLAEYLDAGKLAEKFAIDFFLSQHLPVPAGQYVSLTVNGRRAGLYLDMEHVGGDLAASIGLGSAAKVFRCGGRNCEMKDRPPAESYQQDFELKGAFGASAEPEMQELLRVINRTDAADFERELEARIDLDAYLGNLAADLVISNNFIEDARSFWIFQPEKTRWTYVPWDLNNAYLLFYRTWAPTDPPIVKRPVFAFSAWDPVVAEIWATRSADPSYQPTWSVLNSRIWQQRALRERVTAKLRQALDGAFGESKAGAHVDALWAAIRDEVYADPFVSKPHADAAVSFLKTYIRGRRSFLAGAMSGLAAGPWSEIVVNEIGFPGGGQPGYVELYNRGSTRSVAGLVVSDDARKPLLYALPAGTELVAGGKLLLVADGSSAPGHLPFQVRRDGGEIAVYDGTRVYGPLDLVYFGPHGSGASYGRTRDGGDDWAEITPSPGGAN